MYDNKLPNYYKHFDHTANLNKCQNSFHRMSPEMRLDPVDGITVTSVGGGVATIATRPGGGNTFAYVASGASSIGGESYIQYSASPLFAVFLSANFNNRRL